MASMRIWPKAPRACLLARISWRETMLVDRSVRFFCAVSITASRSLSLAIGFMRLARGLGQVGADAVGDAVEPLVDGPRDVALAVKLISAKLCKLPFKLGKFGRLGLGLRAVARSYARSEIMARVISARTARLREQAATRTGSSMMFPILNSSGPWENLYFSPDSFLRPKQEHVDRPAPQPYVSRLTWPSVPSSPSPIPILRKRGRTRRARRRRRC